jgi:malonyl-CoA decarboxylase
LFSSILSSTPSGMKTIVSIRSDVRTLKSENRGLDELDFNMRAQLSNWFSAGILELRRITYDSTPGEKNGQR